MHTFKQIEKLNETNSELMKESGKYVEAHLKYMELWREIEHNQIKIQILKKKAGIVNELRPCDEELLAHYRGEDRLMEAI